MTNRNTCSKIFLGMGAFLAVSVLSTVNASADTTALKNRVEALNKKLANVRITSDLAGNPLVVIEGANVRIEPEGEGTGNLIVGSDHIWTNSTGGFVSGYRNIIEGKGCTVNGGLKNSSRGSQSTISGGYTNRAFNLQSTIIGGFSNSTNNMQGKQATVCGGYYSSVNNDYATVGGGFFNEVNGVASVASGGASNVAGGQSSGYAVTAGGLNNSASGNYSIVLGGNENQSSGEYAVVVSGNENIASGNYSIIFGGGENKATNERSSVAGGKLNICRAETSLIVAGSENEIMSCNSGYLQTLSGGYKNVMRNSDSGRCGSPRTLSGGALAQMEAGATWCLGNEECYGNNSLSNIYTKGKTIGKLRFYDEIDDPQTPENEDEPVTVQDIVILRKVPNDLSRVGGIISTVYQIPLAHVTVMAKQTNIPNIWVEDILNYLKPNGTFEVTDHIGENVKLGGYVELTVSENGYTLNGYSSDEAGKRALEAHLADIRPDDDQHPPRELGFQNVAPLHGKRPDIFNHEYEVDFPDYDAFGGKAANVAEMLDIEELPEGMVPDGVGVPFYFYDEFMKMPRSHSFYTQFEELYYCNFDVSALEIDDYLDELEEEYEKQGVSFGKDEKASVVAEMFKLKFGDEIINEGWYWFDTYDEITFLGEACGRLKSGAVTSVTAEFGERKEKRARSTFYEEFMQKIKNCNIPENPFKEAISFYHYASLMIYDDYNFMTADEYFRNQPRTRADDLTVFRKLIEGLPGEAKEGNGLPAGMAEELDKIYEYFISIYDDFDEKSHLRCRSSSNNEDLIGFSGAGLFDSKTHKPGKNGQKEGHIAKTIREIWASLWTYRAYEARWFYKIPHLEAAMGVLVHRNYKDELVNGVSVTRNISKRVSEPGYYVNAQKGETKIVAGEGFTPEEFVILMPSYEPSYINWSSQIYPWEKLVGPDHIVQFADAMEIIHAHFIELYEPVDPGKFAMDLEFKITSNNNLAIKQARPWVDPDTDIDAE